MNKIALSTLAISSLFAGLTATSSVLAQEGVIEEIITTGTRSVKARSAADSPVPVDVISQDEINAIGNTADMTDIIRTLVPSFTATPATADDARQLIPEPPALRTRPRRVQLTVRIRKINANSEKIRLIPTSKFIRHSDVCI